MTDKIKFYDYHPFIHAYHIEGIHSWLLQFKEDLINRFLDQQAKANNIDHSFNIPIVNEVMRNTLADIFSFIVEEYYLVDKAYSIKNAFGVYVQNNERSDSFYHTHYRNTLAATLYIDPPINGGELSIMEHEKNPIAIQPKKDYIYFFPGWLMHKPTPQQDTTYRVCINWTYACNTRAIHKLVGSKW